MHYDSVFTKQGGTKLIASLSPHSATNNPEHICDELSIHCMYFTVVGGEPRGHDIILLA